MKVVLTYGTFDVLHYGHIRLLKRAKELGDYLIVGLSTDEFNAIKGKKSYYSYEQRKEILESLKYVDMVIPENDWNQKVTDIKKYNASCIAMGSDWKGDSRFEKLKDFCDVVFLDRTEGVSSTETKIYLGHELKKMKWYKKFAINLFKVHLRFIYLFLKLLKTKNNRIVYISRRTNKCTLEFSIIKDSLKDYNLENVILCKKMKKGFKGAVKYYFEILKQMYYLATSKVCITDSYCIPISVLKHKKSLKVIQSWHAMAAIKKFGFQNLDKDYGRNSEMSKLMDMHKNYDYVVSGSTCMNKYFSEAFNTDINKVHAIGSPTVDYLTKNKEEIRKKIYEKYPELLDKPVILYVPTFRNQERIDISNLMGSIDLDKYNFVVKLHPNSKITYNDNSFHRCKGFYALELLTIADYIITDYSSIMIEASLMNKPLYLYVYDYDSYVSKNGLNVNLFEELPNCVFKNPTDLVKSLDSNIYDLDMLRRFKEKYIANEHGYSTEILKSYILSNIENVEYEKNKVYTDTTI